MSRPDQRTRLVPEGKHLCLKVTTIYNPLTTVTGVTTEHTSFFSSGSVKHIPPSSVTPVVGHKDCRRRFVHPHIEETGGKGDVGGINKTVVPEGPRVRQSPLPSLESIAVHTLEDRPEGIWSSDVSQR